MREIKFRCWDKVNKRMVDVINIEGLHRFMILEVRIPNTKEYYVIENEDDFELMQYTGLKDNSNPAREIYEGDIISTIIYGNKYVEYDTAGTAFGCKGLITKKWDGPLGMYKNLRVIGNIHENPELLEGGGKDLKE